MGGISYFLKQICLTCLTIATFTTKSLLLHVIRTKIPTLVTGYGGPARFTPSVTLTFNTLTSSGHEAVVTTSALTIVAVISE